MYRVTFNLEGKTHQVRAKTIEANYPMVFVRDLIWSSGSALIVAPEDETAKRFQDAKELILPFHTIQLIEDISERKPDIRAIKPDDETESLPKTDKIRRDLTFRPPPTTAD